MSRSGRACCRLGAVAMLGLPTAGCDPIINVYGSFFPAWTVSLVTGLMLTIALRVAFATTGLERHLKPLVLVYPCLLLLMTCVIWIALFRS